MPFRDSQIVVNSEAYPHMQQLIRAELRREFPGAILIERSGETNGRIILDVQAISLDSDTGESCLVSKGEEVRTRFESQLRANLFS